MLARQVIYRLSHASSPVLDIFQIGFVFCFVLVGLMLIWITIFSIYFFHVAGMTGVCHHSQLLVEVGSRELFVWAGLKL
jgi:apolipoprotein N-acyltransferase